MLSDERARDVLDEADGDPDADDISSVDEANRRNLEGRARASRRSTLLDEQAAVKEEQRAIHNYSGTRMMGAELQDLVELHFNKDPKAALFKYIGDTNYDERRALIQSLPRTDKPEEMKSPEGVVAIDNVVNRIRGCIPSLAEVRKHVAIYKSRMDNDGCVREHVISLPSLSLSLSHTLTPTASCCYRAAHVVYGVT